MGIPFDVSDVAASLVATIVLIVAKWAFDQVSFLDKKFGLLVNRAELRKIEWLRSDPTNLTHFLLIQGLYCFGAIAMGFLLLPLAFMNGGMKLLVPCLLCVGFAMYFCVVFPLGMLVRLRKGDAYVKRQQECIAQAEKHLERHQQRKKP
ncbi:hypothetical protein N018_12140 [Pseudomonas syringae CC1557]|uniref:Uncharacterized protein n=2 Tax=Gammaproteobacteria TaxID=1236 RepID=W0N268_PSESX|nr:MULTISPECIES: hypothetical protein [Gammaproteobacteria]AHG43570.1 hypothetical protein N018_12140 [Pseudomonas syringae CC1557]QSQ35323.1 hypothetical protein ISN31_07190 [Xanthomonas translucens pv. translucens]QSQ44127.1 hypothetical protein ISN34_12580 [Xanthomonas translucens pv. translucens]